MTLSVVSTSASLIARPRARISRRGLALSLGSHRSDMFWWLQVVLTSPGLPCQPGWTVQALGATAAARFWSCTGVLARPFTY
jgi:hypothetical protein